jgi:phospholipid-binding lipoprotein MlaA
VKRIAASLVLAATLALAGCATTGAPPAGGSAPAVATNPVDPWEAWNRKVFAFNETVDEAVLKPVAEGYRKVVPSLVRRGIDNVFSNIGDAWSAANHLLQGKLQSGVEMGFRFLTNTLLGLGGVLDPASEMGLTRRSEDFGQTLGKWGVPTGPYVVLPFLGPSNPRDGLGLLVDRQTAPSTLPATEAGRFGTAALELINTRSNLLGATGLIDSVALDKYSFLRDAYLQRRLDAVYDGAPPMEDFGDDSPDDKKSVPNRPPPAQSK